MISNIIPALSDLIEQTTGSQPRASRSIGGGLNSSITVIDLADGNRVVLKAGRPGTGLDLEGFMLAYLRTHSSLPVPGVYHSDDTALIMDWVENSGSLNEATQHHAAELLVSLHAISGDIFGLIDDSGAQRDTLIGGLHQPNPPTECWLDFFRDHRLLYMAGQAYQAERLLLDLRKRIDTLAGRLDRWLEEPWHPGLVHGDMWGGNVLCCNNAIAGFIDPAIYYGHAEIELAFSTLFSTFGEPFFARYDEIRPIAPGFFEQRRDLYNLYPLLVHTRLFGGHYVGSVERTLEQFGC